MDNHGARRTGRPFGWPRTCLRLSTGLLSCLAAGVGRKAFPGRDAGRRDIAERNHFRAACGDLPPEPGSCRDSNDAYEHGYPSAKTPSQARPDPSFGAKRQSGVAVRGILPDGPFAAPDVVTGVAPERLPARVRKKWSSGAFPQRGLEAVPGMARPVACCWSSVRA